MDNINMKQTPLHLQAATLLRKYINSSHMSEILYSIYSYEEAPLFDRKSVIGITYVSEIINDNIEEHVYIDIGQPQVVRSQTSFTNICCFSIINDNIEEQLIAWKKMNKIKHQYILPLLESQSILSKIRFAYKIQML